MSLKITVTIKGSEKVQRKLVRLGSKMTDLSRSMDKIGETLSSYYANEGVLSQGGVFGNRWVRLNQQYALRKARRYPGRPPMVATGKLVGGFTHSSTSHSTTITNKTPYFKYHQSTRPRTIMPRRQMIGVNTAVNKVVRQLITEDVSRAVRSM